MTNTERVEMAAKKVLDLIAGALDKLVVFQMIEMPDGKTMYAICFSVDLWDFDGRRLKLKPTKPGQK